MNNKKRRTTSTKRKKNKFNFPIKDKGTIYALIAAIVLLVFIKLIGLAFTVVLILGIILIIFGSKLINKLRKKKYSRRIINTLIIAFLICCIAGVVGCGAFFLYIVQSAPKFDVNKLKSSESTLIYDNNNNLIAELGTEKREIITYDQISEVLVDAIIATEDSRFFQHNGFDAARFLKASIGQVLHTSGAGGASTLSMQVIKNSFTSSEASGIKGIVRKFTDIYMSVFKLEKNYSKEEIIEYYVNNHFLGNNSYGVQQAAKSYFGKNASELNLAEASLIVGLFKAPTKYNPYINPDEAALRRETVLKLMYKHGYITKEEMNMANSIPVQSLLGTQKGETHEYQGYIDTVVEEIDEKYNVNPYNTPMKIYTNMDSKKQKAMDDIFNGVSYSWENDYIQAGIVALDSHSGKIIAVGAGRNKTTANSYNFATMSNRQIGSTSKPFIDYAPGMEFLNWSTYTIFDDSPYQYSSGQPINNSDEQTWGKITLRTALMFSKNIPALKAFQAVSKEIGLKKYKEFIQNFGLTPESYLHEAHAIGAFNGSNPLEMAGAYAVFSNGGTYYKPYSVNKIIYRDTGEEVVYKSEGKRIISEATAWMITDCLMSTVQSGYSNTVRMSGYNIAAKTGTTNYTADDMNRLHLPYGAIPDSWLIGYDPNATIAIWYGCEKADANHYSIVNRAVMNIAGLFKTLAPSVLTPGSNFTIPSTVVKLPIEKGSEPAKLASPNTPEDQITYEYFKVGTEPTESSIKYSKLSNPTGLEVNYNVSDLSMTLDWNGVANTVSEDTSSYGDFGYKIYKDNVYIGFTEDTTYTILDVNEPDGVYKVVTSFKNYSDNASNGITYTYQSESQDILNVTLKHSTSNYSVGDTLASYDEIPSSNDVIVNYNSEIVTDDATIKITITDKTSSIVSKIDTTQANTYTITYKITYNLEVKKLTRKVKIG